MNFPNNNAWIQTNPLSLFTTSLQGINGSTLVPSSSDSLMKSVFSTSQFQNPLPNLIQQMAAQKLALLNPVLNNPHEILQKKLKILPSQTNMTPPSIMNNFNLLSNMTLPAIMGSANPLSQFAQLTTIQKYQASPNIDSYKKIVNSHIPTPALTETVNEKGQATAESLGKEVSKNLAINKLEELPLKANLKRKSNQSLKAQRKPREVKKSIDSEEEAEENSADEEEEEFKIEKSLIGSDASSICIDDLDDLNFEKTRTSKRHEKSSASVRKENTKASTVVKEILPETIIEVTKKIKELVGFEGIDPTKVYTLIAKNEMDSNKALMRVQVNRTYYRKYFAISG